MAGGINTTAFVREVIRCGGVGSYGFAYSTPAAIEQELHQLSLQELGCTNANFFVFPPLRRCDVSPAAAPAALSALEERCPLRIGSYALPSADGIFPSLDEQLEAVFRRPPAYLSFHFGLPDEAVVERAHGHGVAVGTTVTSVREAALAAASGIDFVVAQGAEAGGHRGTMPGTADADDELLPTLALVAALSAARRSTPAHGTPPAIVAAGGLMTGADIAEALVAGADAVQLGTAFLLTHESGAPAAHKKALAESISGSGSSCGGGSGSSATTGASRRTVLTAAFSGRRARGLENEFTRRMAGQPTLPFPLQYALTKPRRQQAMAEGDPEFQALWAGAHYTRSRPALSVAELMAALQREFAEALSAKGVEALRVE